MNRSNLLSRLTLAFVLAVGLTTAWFVVLAWTSSTFIYRSAGTYESLVFTPEGEPVIQMNALGRIPSSRYRGLDGQPRDFTSEAVWLQAATAIGTSNGSWANRPVTWNARIMPFSDGGTPPTFWYFLHDGRRDGRGYFVGYDSVSRQVVGFFGRSGFRDAPPASSQDKFQVPLVSASHLNNVIASSQSQYYYRSVHEPWYFDSSSREFPGWHAFLIDGNQVVDVDLRKRDAATRVLLEADGLLSLSILHATNVSGSPVRSAAAFELQEAAKKQPDVLIASTADQIIVYDPLTQKADAIDRPDALVGLPLQVYRTDSGDFILVHVQYELDRAGQRTMTYWLGPDGVVKDQKEVLLDRGTPTPAHTKALTASLAAPLPLASTAFVLLKPVDWMQREDDLTYGQALARSLGGSWLFIVLTYALASLLAWRCYVRQRRYAEAIVVPWLAFVWLFGLPGYVAYRLHRRWPVRLPCPSCSMPSPRDRDDCTDCGAEFPRPELKGSEVFA